MYRQYKFLVVVLLVVTLGYLIYRHYHNRGQAVPGSSNQSQQTSSRPTSRSTSSQNSSFGSQGGATDNHGAGVTSSSGTNSISSSSGVITLYSPSPNSTLSSGDKVSGSAKVSEVQYRLVDDQVGVLAQGQLSVVNGLFSGTLQFRPRALTGKLAVFSFDTNDAEINKIEINVKFGS